jgi:hypothetical protein
MTGITGIKRCGGCHFARLNPQIIAQDITKRVCYGAPPSAIQLPAQDGRIHLQMARPVVSVSEDACALWKAKGAEDIVHDADALKFMQDHELKVPETKQ